MSSRTITLSLPEATLQKAESLADQRHTSLSGLLAGLIESLVGRGESYEQARERHLAILERGYDLGTQGSTVSREKLHER